MKKLIDLIQEELVKAFTAAEMDPSYARVSVSNRPDLCEYQCNGAMAAAKAYHKAPIQLAEAVVEKVTDHSVIGEIEAVKPGFINLKINPEFLADYLSKMQNDEELSVEKAKNPKTIIVDYGGANVAKPLHVGHLRSAIIGESIKRMGRFMGHNMIGDVHLGDWGLQMGLIITELQERHPELVYFDESFTGEYPEEAPFTISELEEIYPCASGKSKEDEDYKKRALEATRELQQGRRGYRAIWKHIMNVSVADLKKNYGNLDVHFDLWMGESDAQEYIPDMVDYLKDNGYAHYDQGALVVDVKEETDTKEIPPCMILKSDGAALYDTTDLATIIQRMKLYKPDEICYLADKRQELHFVQCFRCARKAKLVNDDTVLSFIGFGTMNGKDGKPFKTREGGVMRLERLIGEINDEMYQKIVENRSVKDTDARGTAQIVADTEKWLTYVAPLIGGSDIIIFAHGQDLSDWHDYTMDNEKFAYLKSQGFNIYCNVDSSQYFVQVRDNYLRMGRRNLDGYRLYQNLYGGGEDRTSDLFDSASVIDPQRPTDPSLYNLG